MGLGEPVPSLQERLGVGVANLAVTDIRFTDLASNPIGQVVNGTDVVIEVHFATEHIPAGATYDLVLDVNGDVRRNTISLGAGLGGPFDWFFRYGFRFRQPGPYTARATIDETGVVAESSEADNTIEKPFTSLRLPPPQLLLPMGGVPFEDWVIVNYVDLDPGFGDVDYRGGPFTYDSHNGIDFTLPNFSAMDAGVPVMAAAEGTVIFMFDGGFDRETAGGNFDSTNFVTIDHGDGWWTEYIHLRRDSITVQVGDHVAPGEIIGEVGSSGNSTAAHLHFNVFNGEPVEPYLDPDLFWIDPLPYQGDFNVSIAHGTTLGDPFPTLLQGERPPDKHVFLYGQEVWLWNVISTTGDNTIEVLWIDPNGAEHARHVWTDIEAIRGGFWLGVLFLPGDAQLGQWEAAFLVDGEELSRETFTVAAVGTAEIRIDQGDQFIVNGRSTPIDFGQVDRGDPATPTHTFTVTNYGEVDLNLGAIDVPPGFIVTEGLGATLGAGESDSFTIALDHRGVGRKSGGISISSSDAGEGDYRFAVEGEVIGLGVVAAVGGSTWSQPFLSALEQAGLSGAARAEGLAMSEQVGQPTPTWPWVNLDRIQLVFTQPVTITADAIVLQGLNQPSPAVTDFNYEPATMTAIWRLTTPLASDRWSLTLADSFGASADAGTTEATDYLFQFNVAVGDADRDGSADSAGAEVLRQALGSASDSAPARVFADLDGDGVVSVFDL